MKNKIRFYDNTRVSTFRSCPRKYYYRHVRHWTAPEVEIPLIAGTAWHKGMDEIWQGHGADKASQAWAESMETAGVNLNDPAFGLEEIRNFGTFKAMFQNYEDQRAQFLSEIELIACERPFAVPLGPTATTYYIGRLDKVFHWKNRIYVAEHKTTSWYKKDGGFRPIWINSFSPNSQIDGYLFGGHMMWPDEFKQVLVDAALVHKTVHDCFRFIPIDRKLDALNLWLYETVQWTNQIEINTDFLEKHEGTFPNSFSKSRNFMACFPRNTDACTAFNRECLYREPCIAWPDPSIMGLPRGFIEEKWEPFSEDELKEVL